MRIEKACARMRRDLETLEIRELRRARERPQRFGPEIMAAIAKSDSALAGLEAYYREGGDEVAFVRDLQAFSESTRELARIRDALRENAEQNRRGGLSHGSDLLPVAKDDAGEALHSRNRNVPAPAPPPQREEDHP